MNAKRPFIAALLAMGLAGNAFAASSPPYNGGKVANPVNAPSYQIGGNPFVATVTDINGNIGTLIGANAGLNLGASAIEATFIGYGAGGSGLNGGGVGGTGITGTEDTCVGWHCFSQMTTGQFNTGLGVNVMGFETTGANNVAVGTDAMRNSVGKSNSIAIGVNANRNNNGGSTVAIGVNALFGNPSNTSSGANVIAIGANAFTSQVWSTGNSDIAIGSAALGSASLTTASSVIAIGTSAGAAVTTGTNDVFIGDNAGAVSQNGANNVGVGVGALSTQGATSLSGDTAVGYQALENAAGTDNTAVGQQAGLGLSGGGAGNSFFGSKVQGGGGTGYNDNTFIGFETGFHISGGSNNTILGALVGSTTISTGTGNILIGTSAGVDTPLSSTSNYLNIGNVITATGAGAAVGSVVTIPGTLSFGSLTATTCTNSGFITINDNGGTSRKLMVCA